MKYVKILGLLAVAATALMVFSAIASATTLTSPEGTPLKEGATLHGENENGHVTLANPIANISCASTVEGKIAKEGEGGAGKPVTGEITHLTFTGCTNSWHVTTISPGDLSLTWKAAGEGSLTSTGAKVETTRIGVKCVYVTNNTAIGTATDTSKTKSTPTLHVSAGIPISKAESSALCGEGNAKWEGAYVLTNPMTGYIDQN